MFTVSCFVDKKIIGVSSSEPFRIIPTRNTKEEGESQDSEKSTEQAPGDFRNGAHGRILSKNQQPGLKSSFQTLNNSNRRLNEVLPTSSSSLRGPKRHRKDWECMGEADRVRNGYKDGLNGMVAAQNGHSSIMTGRNEEEKARRSSMTSNQILHMMFLHHQNAENESSYGPTALSDPSSFPGPGGSLQTTITMTSSNSSPSTRPPYAGIGHSTFSPVAPASNPPSTHFFPSPSQEVYPSVQASTYPVVTPQPTFPPMCSRTMAMNDGMVNSSMLLVENRCSPPSLVRSLSKLPVNSQALQPASMMVSDPGQNGGVYLSMAAEQNVQGMIGGNGVGYSSHQMQTYSQPSPSLTQQPSQQIPTMSSIGWQGLAAGYGQNPQVHQPVGIGSATSTGMAAPGYFFNT